MAQKANNRSIYIKNMWLYQLSYWQAMMCMHVYHHSKVHFSVWHYNMWKSTRGWILLQSTVDIYTFTAAYVLRWSSPSSIRCPFPGTRWSTVEPWSRTWCLSSATRARWSSPRKPSRPGSATAPVRTALTSACTKLCSPGWTETDGPPVNAERRPRRRYVFTPHANIYSLILPHNNPGSIYSNITSDAI